MHPGDPDNCRDNSGWVDQFGHGCKDYIKDGHCAGGHVLHDWITEAEFRFPHHNCCACGGGIQKQAGECTPNCQDTPYWKDSFGHGCDGYVRDGKCTAEDCEVVHEHGYIKEKYEFKQPHLNCCACGK